MKTAISQFFKKVGLQPSLEAKRKRRMQVIGRQTTSLHRAVRIHWRIAKSLFIILMLVGVYLEYRLYQQINEGAFELTTQVEQIETDNIEAERLIEILLEERERQGVFATSIERGPISFDPAQYDVVLRKAEDVDSKTNISTNTEDVL